ncbi:MAG TPA: lytic murein transglycosylase B [Gammaproteobacteria bacterium]|nr:lytic murein transglycosylase B [Gammaproteobacteria bacterium]
MRSLLLTGVAAGLFGCATFTVAEARFGQEGELESFVQDMANRHDFDTTELRQLLDQAEPRQDIIDAMKNPAERLPWHRYRPIFLKPDRIAQGVAFWNDNSELLEKISTEYGVPPEILVAIVGVETYYGRHKGRHRVLDALATLGFNYPPRAQFFRRELEQYLLLAREERLDPLQLTGSYAGAMGMPQFIPSSYRSYAVDGDGDGRRDLFSNTADIMASVANYFRRHNWETGGLIAAPAQVSGKGWLALNDQDLKPVRTFAQLTAAGVSTTTAAAADAPARLLVLEAADGDEHWATFHNFYVITRYNRSPLYAMAVFQLAQQIKNQRTVR